MKDNHTDIHALPSEKFGGAALRALTRRSLFPWLGDAALDWVVIATALAAVTLWPHVAVFAAAVLVIGNRQHALTVLGHDGTHYTLSRNARLNDFLTNLLCFWPLGLTVSGYRALHYAHHAHTGTENDPELGHKRMRAPQWDLPNTPIRVLRYALLDLVGFSRADYVIIVRFAKPQSRREYAPLALFHLAALGLLLCSGLWLAAAAWYVSLVTSFMMFFRLRLWLEHQGTDDTQRLALTWSQGALLAPHNAWHHWEHHKYPTIPYHRLPQARRRLKGPAILTLRELIASFAGAWPIASGTVLRATATNQDEEREIARAATLHPPPPSR
jgi:fatty acid desaturase